MRPVLVLIFHAEAPADAGPLVRSLAEARGSMAVRQRNLWLAAGADDVAIVSGPPDDLAFGERLRMVLPRHGRGPISTEVRARAAAGGAAGGGAAAGGAAAGGAAAGGAAASEVGGLIVLGSGSIPLARVPDLRRFVDVAAGPGGHALANNSYSADVVALSRPADLAGLPPLPSDNALPRWLEERAGVSVTDLRRRWRLGVDVDTPLDLLVLEYAEAGRGRGRTGHSPAGGSGHSPAGGSGHSPAGGSGHSPAGGRVGGRLRALSDVLRNRRAELLVAGRISATTLQFLESGVECRVRALVEERGLRAASLLAQAGPSTAARPPRSVLGELLDRDGPESLARHVATLADAAVIDTRVLMAHRYGAAESAWPSAEDRFASDLLDPNAVSDPWLRALTSAATGGSIPGQPILLGGHALVNGGLRLLAQRARAGEP